jgi:uncharacterized membrane protein YidH (DUF202 family)
MSDPPSELNTAPRERTLLAWHRVSLAIATNGALLFHAGLSDRTPFLTAAGCAVGTIGALLWLVSSPVEQTSPKSAPRWIMEHPVMMPLLAGVVLSVSLIDLVGVVLA